MVGYAQFAAHILAYGLERRAIEHAAVCSSCLCRDLSLIGIGGFDKLLLKFQLDGLTDHFDTLLRIHHSWAFHKQVTLVTHKRRRDRGLAHTQCIDAAFQDGANSFYQVGLLLHDGIALETQLCQCLAAWGSLFHRGNLRVHIGNFLADFFFRNTEVQLCSTYKIETQV